MTSARKNPSRHESVCLGYKPAWIRTTGYAAVVAAVMAGTSGVSAIAVSLPLVDGTLSGQYSCDENLSPISRSKAPFSLPIELAVRQGQVSGKRENPQTVDAFSGSVNPSGLLTVELEGHWKDEPSRRWLGRFKGSLRDGLSRIPGEMLATDSRTKLRDCALLMTFVPVASRSALSASSAPALATTPSVPKLPMPSANKGAERPETRTSSSITKAESQPSGSATIPTSPKVLPTQPALGQPSTSVPSKDRALGDAKAPGVASPEIAAPAASVGVARGREDRGPLVGTWDCQPELMSTYRVAYFGDGTFILRYIEKDNVRSFYTGTYETDSRHLIREDAFLLIKKGQQVFRDWTATHDLVDARTNFSTYRSRTFWFAREAGGLIVFYAIDMSLGPNTDKRLTNVRIRCQSIGKDQELELIRRETPASVFTSIGKTDSLASRIGSVQEVSYGAVDGQWTCKQVASSAIARYDIGDNGTFSVWVHGADGSQGTFSGTFTLKGDIFTGSITKKTLLRASYADLRDPNSESIIRRLIGQSQVVDNPGWSEYRVSFPNSYSMRLAGIRWLDRATNNVRDLRTTYDCKRV